MIIDPDLRKVDEPVVTLKLSMQQAEWVSNGLSDLLCWARGFNAALSKDDHDRSPIGVSQAREMNIALKRAIERAEK